MHAPALTWSALLVLSLSAPQAQSPLQKKWKPLFDYTNLPPANEVFWEPLSQASVPLEAALDVARKGEQAPVHLSSAEFVPAQGESGPTWRMELFVAASEQAPRRVNVTVSALEPKVLKRLELLSLAPDEQQTWELLRKVAVPLEVAVQLAKDSLIGKKPEPDARDPRARTARFMPVPGAPVWLLEMMNIELKKDDEEQLRRWEFHVNSRNPNVKQRLMIDRFSGEPLRKGQPTEQPNGTFLYDFVLGDGQEIAADSRVRVNYRLFLLDTTKLHDTWQTKQSETFVVSKAPLAGMREGMLGMRVGGRRKIAMPYGLAFGEAGNEVAPPKAMIVCDVQVEELITQ